MFQNLTSYSLFLVLCCFLFVVFISGEREEAKNPFLNVPMVETAE